MELGLVPRWNHSSLISLAATCATWGGTQVTEAAERGEEAVQGPCALAGDALNVHQRGEYLLLSEFKKPVSFLHR